VSKPKFDWGDDRALVVASPVSDVPKEAWFAFNARDARFESVIIPERYLHDLANRFYPVTRDMGVFWQTIEDDWIEANSDLERFQEALSDAMKSELWPTRVHFELVQTLGALVERAINRRASVYFFG